MKRLGGTYEYGTEGNHCRHRHDLFIAIELTGRRQARGYHLQGALRQLRRDLQTTGFSRVSGLPERTQFLQYDGRMAQLFRHDSRSARPASLAIRGLSQGHVRRSAVEPRRNGVVSTAAAGHSTLPA